MDNCIELFSAIVPLTDHKWVLEYQKKDGFLISCKKKNLIKIFIYNLNGKFIVTNNDSQVMIDNINDVLNYLKQNKIIN